MMALFDTFVFNVVIAAICLLAIHEVFKAFRFEKAAYIYWGFVPYTLLVMFSDFHMVRICMLPASYIFALYLVLCVIGNSKSINYAKLGGMVLFSCIIMFCFYSLKMCIRDSRRCVLSASIPKLILNCAPKTIECCLPKTSVRIYCIRADVLCKRLCGRRKM